MPKKKNKTKNKKTRTKHGKTGNELVVIGVHTPEFPFEHNPDNVR